MRNPCRRSLPLLAARAATGLACLLLATANAGEIHDAPPSGSGGGVALDPATRPAAPARQRAVYVCLDGGIPMYADRPCGTTAVVRALDVDPPRAGDTMTVAPPAPRAATRPRRLPAAEPDRPERPATGHCDALHRQLAAIDDRMRAGYSAREAARLWQRWRDLRERLRTSRC